MKNVDCIFCGKNRARGKEHIWPQWLQININGKLLEDYLGVTTNFIEPEKGNVRHSSGSSLVFGKVCAICNNGWMSRMEDEFKAFFIKARNDYNVISIISKKERANVSIWALKTSMMINSASNYKQVIPIEFYRHIEKYRTTPKNIKIDICYIDDGHEFGNNVKLDWRMSNIYGAIHKSSISNETIQKDLLDHSFATSLQLEHLGIRVSYYKNAKELGVKLPKPSNSRALRIWPYEKDSNFDIKNGFKNIEALHVNTMIKK